MTLPPRAANLLEIRQILLRPLRRLSILFRKSGSSCTGSGPRRSPCTPARCPCKANSTPARTRAYTGAAMSLRTSFASFESLSRVNFSKCSFPYATAAAAPSTSDAADARPVSLSPGSFSVGFLPARPSVVSRQHAHVLELTKEKLDPRGRSGVLVHQRVAAFVPATFSGRRGRPRARSATSRSTSPRTAPSSPRVARVVWASARSRPRRRVRPPPTRRTSPQSSNRPTR